MVLPACKLRAKKECSMTKTIAITLFDDADELDVVGPWEVLTSWTRLSPDDGWQAVTVGVNGSAPVRCVKGMVITPQGARDEAGPIDAIMQVGGNGTVELMKDDAHLAWIRDQMAQGLLITSVCTGALVLATAGVLHNRPATTHWASLDQLAQIDPTIDVRPNDRFVDDGNVVTSAGVSAGIDMALHLVARLGSVDSAKAVRRLIQYDPAPPV
jgi:transcriptional regulator GlxA family with amidase domain